MILKKKKISSLMSDYSLVFLNAWAFHSERDGTIMKSVSIESAQLIRSSAIEIEN